MPQSFLRFARIAAAAVLGIAAMAMTRADAPAETGAPRRGERFQNNYVEFEPKGLTALVQWKIDASREGLPKPPQQPTPRVAPDLAFLRASSKNRERRNGKVVGNATLTAIEHLHRNRMYVVGGLIVGNPDDTRDSIEANLEFARRHVDWPYIQHPTPYPGTPMTADFRDRSLIVSERVEEYDGTTAVVRSEHLSAEEIEFQRWRAERWMKVRHLPAVLRQSPLFLLRHGHRMMSHTFRGCTLRTILGLESERAAFERYKEIRRIERRYIDDGDSGEVRSTPLSAPDLAS